MLSYWEQQTLVRYDHVVVGSGIVGMSAALELRRHFPNDSIALLERGILPTGASTRNAGFACAGSLTELLDDLEQSPEEEVVALFEARLRGLRKLRARLGDAAIGYAEEGSHELIAEDALPAIDQIGRLNGLLRSVCGSDAFAIRTERIPCMGFHPGRVKALVENLHEGGLHSGMLAQALLYRCREAHIALMTGVRVSRFEEEADGVRILIGESPSRSTALQLRAGTLCICTNAFTKTLLPDEDIQPGRGQVLITEPLRGLPFRGIFHMHRGYYYFRNLDGRILIGGGRHLDKEGETTTELGFHDGIQQDLERQLRELIIPGRPFRVAQRWAGIMAFGPTKQPVVKAIGQRVFGAFRMGGMGVALGSEVAEQLGTLVAERRS